MKKIIVTLAVLLLATPVMATVTITCTASGPNEVTVSFTSDEGQLVRAIALDVQIDDPNVVIADVNCVHAGYNIYPGSIDIDAGGNVIDYGTCAGELDGNSMTSEQGSLYADGEDPPVQSGALFILTLSGCTLPPKGGLVAVTVSENALRGGIVMEDPDVGPTSVVLNGCTDANVGCVYETCTLPNCCTTCKGDLNGDGWKMVPDLFMMLNLLGQAGAPYAVPKGHALYTDCADMNGDLWIMVPDMFILLNQLGAAGAPYTIPCP